MNDNSTMADALAEAMGMSGDTRPEQADPQETVTADPPEMVAEEEGTEEEVEVEGDDGGEIRTVSQLMEAIEADPEAFYALELEFGDGVDVPEDLRTVGAIKDAVTQVVRQRSEIESARQALEREKSETLARLNQIQPVQEPPELMQARATVQAIQQAIQETDWAAMRQQDPMKAMAYKQDLQDTLQQKYGEFQQLSNQYQEAMVNQRRQVLQANYAELTQRRPELRDPEQFKGAQQQVLELGQRYGYSPEEVQSWTDFRPLLMMLDLADLSGKDKAAKQAVQKALKAPAMAKPGARLGGGGGRINAKALQSRIAKAKRPDATKEDKLAAMDAVFKSHGL
jgi:hypothetical protein